MKKNNTKRIPAKYRTEFKYLKKLEGIGYCGIFCLNISFIPQLYLVVTTEQVTGLSPFYMGLFFIGLSLLQVYTYANNNAKMYKIANWIGMGCSSTLLYTIWLWG